MRSAGFSESFKGSRRVVLGLLVLGVGVTGLAVAMPAFAAPKKAPDFSFLRTMSLRQGDRFGIYAKTPGLLGTSLSRIGQGRIETLTPRALRFRFQVSILTREISGDVSLRLAGRAKNDLLFQLVYSGKENQRPESSRETVRVDSFLARKGFVSFHYHKSRRFLQISRSSGGENKFVTDWGAATLRKE